MRDMHNINQDSDLQVIYDPSMLPLVTQLLVQEKELINFNNLKGQWAASVICLYWLGHRVRETLFAGSSRQTDVIKRKYQQELENIQGENKTVLDNLNAAIQEAMANGDYDKLTQLGDRAKTVKTYVEDEKKRLETEQKTELATLVNKTLSAETKRAKISKLTEKADLISKNSSQLKGQLRSSGERLKQSADSIRTESEKQVNWVGVISQPRQAKPVILPAIYQKSYFERVKQCSAQVTKKYGVTDQEVKRVLDAVVRGRLDEVGLLLEENRGKHNGYCALLHVQADTTEAEQKFYEMLPKMTGGARQGGSLLMLTPFQFAARESDIEMCELILRYFDAQKENRSAAEQMNALKEDQELIRIYGNPFFDLQATNQAYKTLQDNWSIWSWDQKCKQWCGVIGKHQQSWPAWLRYDMTQPGSDAPWCKKTVNARPQKRDLSANGIKPEYSWAKGNQNKYMLGCSAYVEGDIRYYVWSRGRRTGYHEAPRQAKFEWYRYDMSLPHISRPIAEHDRVCLDNEHLAVMEYRKTLHTKFATFLHNTSENASPAPRQ